MKTRMERMLWALCVIAMIVVVPGGLAQDKDVPALPQDASLPALGSVVSPSTMTTEEIEEYLATANCSFIVNSGFELGPVDWSQTGSNQIWHLPEDAWDGEWLAWQCGYDSCSDRLWQGVDFTGWSEPMLFLFWKLSSQDVGRPYDVFSGYINDEYGNPLHGLFTFSNLIQPKDRWNWESWDLSGLGLADSKWQLSFTGITDLSRPTSFYLDSVLICGRSLESVYLPLIIKEW